MSLDLMVSSRGIFSHRTKFLWAVPGGALYRSYLWLDILDQGTANYSLQAKLCSWPVFVNKVLLEHSHFMHFHTIYGCFPTTTGGFSRCSKILLLAPLTKKRLLIPSYSRLLPPWGAQNLFFFVGLDVPKIIIKI